MFGPLVSIDRSVMMNAAKELEDASRKLDNCRGFDLEPSSMPAELSTFSSSVGQAQSGVRRFIDAECFILLRTAEQTRLPAIDAGLADRVT